MTRSIRILLMEDNPGDARLVEEAMREFKIKNELYIVKDGEAGMDFLHKRGGYAQVPVPDLVLLDLNMPRKDGREVLREMKASDTLRRIPVVVLTTSSSDEDIIASYNLNANCYITKPVDLDQFLNVVQQIEDFWFTIVVLPSSD